MIKNFEQFLNEGFLTKIFKKSKKSPDPEPKEKEIKGDENKADDDIAIWIIKYLNKNGVNENRLEHNYQLGSVERGGIKEKWIYQIIKNPVKSNPEIDPYNEDDWSDNKEIHLEIYKKKSHFSDSGYFFQVKVQKKVIDISDNLLEMITDKLDEPRMERYRLAKEERLAIKKREMDNVRKEIFEKNIVKSIDEDPYNEEYWEDFNDDIFAFINNLVETYNAKYGHIYDCVFSVERKDDDRDNQKNYGGKGAAIKINNRNVICVYDLPGQNSVAITGGTLKYPYQASYHMGYYNYDKAKQKIRSKLLGILKVINKVKQ